MKKLMLSLALVMGLVTTQINAQTVSFGVKGEANMSNFILSDMGDSKSNLGFGASIGGFAKIDFSKYFALQPELMFHFKTSEYEYEYTTFEYGRSNDYQYFGMEIPIYAVGQMQLANRDRAYIGIGPYVGLGFSAKYDGGIYDDVDLYDQEIMQRFDVGAGVMIGYEFNFGMQINAGYKIGFINTLDKGSDNSTMLNQTISLGIGYRF